MPDLSPGSSARFRVAEQINRILTAVVAALSERSTHARLRTIWTTDLVLCVIATWIAFGLRIGVPYVPIWPFTATVALSFFAWSVFSQTSGFYRIVLRSAGGQAMVDLAKIGGLMILSMTAAIVLLAIPNLPRTLGVLQPVTFIGLVGISRLIIRFLLIDFTPRTGFANAKRILIYGAGRAGQQLALSMRHELHLQIVGFYDDNPALHGATIDGRTVFDHTQLIALLSADDLDEILIALPSASRQRRREIVEELQAYPVPVRVLPSAADIISGSVTLSDLRDVQIEDLLGRDPIPPKADLMARQIFQRTVLVTGAGGSIGSELCRQIIGLSPSALILVDHSESALYQIEIELRRFGVDCPLYTELCNVTHRLEIERVMKKHRPETVFHSSAYKHVPLVEANPASGVWNNVFGTLACCNAAEEAQVSNFTLISTDKAVRPTNVMGATKRVCELILQARAKCCSKPNYVMVRFGNVLGSSGSVVPRFREQIAEGGPVTLTHREVTRFFMTIPEAAQLVIQASSMGDSGDVFVLDMGEPVRIIDLATTLIRLSHRSVRDDDDPHGDIEIVETGLRPGEKLYEELLIGDNPITTEHPRIIKAREEMLEWTELHPIIIELQAAVDRGDVGSILTLLQRLVPGFTHTPRA